MQLRSTRRVPDSSQSTSVESWLIQGRDVKLVLALVNCMTPPWPYTVREKNALVTYPGRCMLVASSFDSQCSLRHTHWRFFTPCTWVWRRSCLFRKLWTFWKIREKLYDFILFFCVRSSDVLPLVLGDRMFPKKVLEPKTTDLDVFWPEIWLVEYVFIF